MVRSPSGVTKTRQRAVAEPEFSGRVSKSTPSARMSCVNTVPSPSAATLPAKAAEPPSEAMPAMVLAADPPEDSVPGPICS